MGQNPLNKLRCFTSDRDNHYICEWERDYLSKGESQIIDYSELMAINKSIDIMQESNIDEKDFCITSCFSNTENGIDTVPNSWRIDFSRHNARTKEDYSEITICLDKSKDKSDEWVVRIYPGEITNTPCCTIEDAIKKYKW